MFKTASSIAALSVVALGLSLSISAPANAADLGGDCCADLEERVAELEATTARKGNRKVSLTVSGQVHQMLMYWDDGKESNAYVVGNANDQTNFQFNGEAKISADVTAGYQVTVRINDTLSGSVNQDDDDASGDEAFTLWESYWYLKSERLGQVSLGMAPRATDGVPEHDLSETGAAAYAGVQDIGGGFSLRNAGGGGGLTDLTWGDLYSHFNGDTANVVRYDSPTFAGFVVSASWGEDDMWDVALTYAGDFNSIAIEAAIGYTQSTDSNGVDGGGDDDFDILMGSASILHKPSGLSATIAAGQKNYDTAYLDGDGVIRTPDDAKYIYGKLGWQTGNITKLGTTAFYGEYGRFEDFASSQFAGVANQFNGAAVRITGNEAEVWGVGVVQHIEAAAMQLYLGYRHHSVDIDLLDAAGDRVNDNVEDFQTFVAGGIITF